MQRPTIIRTAAAALIAATLTLAACGGDDEPGATSTAPVASGASGTAGTAAAGENVITIASFAFSGVTEVPAGTVLTVVNDDSTAHTFTADDGSFDSGAIDPGGSAEITLDAPGTYTYACGFHGSMTGTITVTA